MDTTPETTPEPTARPVVRDLVEIVARAVDGTEPVIPAPRLVDALLDVRNEVDDAAARVVDEVLSDCAHRRLVPTEEASELVARVASATAAEPAVAPS